jgi:hypothetical protein
MQVNTVWKPIPNSSQALALDTRCDHTLYCGTRGPGKTATQLMHFRKYVGQGYGAFWRGVIFDREYKNLSDLVAQSKRFFTAFGDGAEWKSSASDYKWVWPTGEELLFRHAKKLEDYDNFHGHEYPWLGWNELTKHATPDLYDKIMSTNRSSFVPEEHTPKDSEGRYLTANGEPLPRIPLKVFSTTNPNGPGHAWVKRRFINPAQYGEVVRKEISAFNPKTQKEEIVVKTQVALFGSYKENPFLDVTYIAELDSLTASDKNLRKAWLEGSWDIIAGGALGDIWNSAVHVIDKFSIPEGWLIDRAFDWGSSHPFSVGWFAEANGEAVTLPDGREFCPVRGSLIQVSEWYGAQEIGLNKGLKLSAKDVADGIKARELYAMTHGSNGKAWFSVQPAPGPADNQIRDVREQDVETIEAKMAKNGIRWTKSDKSAGSRKNGLQAVRDRLQASVTGEGPGLYFFRTCTAAIELLPGLARDPVKLDDVDTDTEDHCYDMLRYRVLAGNNRAAKTLKINMPT